MCKEKDMHLVSPLILEKLTELRDSLFGNPEFDLVVRNQICSFLKRNANRHSVKLEFPYKGNGTKKKAFKNLEIAREYLVRELRENLTEENIQVAASLINGFNHKDSYRTSRAFTQDKQGFFIYPDDVYERMGRFVNRNKIFENPVEKAVHTHFYISFIHPFNDGNGRLARLLQNAILSKNAYPPIIIPSEERGKYLDLISAASREYRESENLLKPKQADFYNYLCSKIRNTLEEIPERIKQRRK
ncbi:MAG: Fic family protein [Nanoarchaeota archaeon]|nr:Fic family protein [Nanoarchaeota archaeon]